MGEGCVRQTGALILRPSGGEDGCRHRRRREDQPHAKDQSYALHFILLTCLVLTCLGVANAFAYLPPPVLLPLKQNRPPLVASPAAPALDAQTRGGVLSFYTLDLVVSSP